MFLLTSQRLYATTVTEKGILLENVDLEGVKEEDLRHCRKRLIFFDGRSSDDEHIPENDRFSKNGYKAVPPPITGNFLTPRADISFARDSVIIEDWTSDDEEEVSGVQKVRPEYQTVKIRDEKCGQNSHKQGVGFRKVKACFVCKSTNHLIKDCNFYDKRSQESNLKNVVNTGKREGKPVWDNTKRVNHQNFSKNPHLSKTFVPSGVLTRTGFVSTTRPSISTARPSISTARPSVSTTRPVCTGRLSINTARPVSTARPSINIARPVSTASPSISIARPGYASRPIYLRMDNVLLQDHAMVDSGCSSHMTGNKAYLSDYEDFNGGFMAFGSDPKGVVLRAPRKDDVYSLDLKNIVPSGASLETISAIEVLWEWRGIANMDFIKLGGSSRVLSDFAEKYGSKNRVLAGFGIGGKSGKEKTQAAHLEEFFENNDLKAQLQDKDSTICKLKDIIKSLREKSKDDNVNYDYCEIETKNVELENKNEDLKAQIQDKVFVITSLKNNLRKIKGKEIVDMAAQIPSASTIVPGMFKLDLEPLAPRLLQNREAHIDYLSAKKVAVTPKNKVKKVRLKCSTSKSRSKPTGNKRNDRISQTPSRNMKNKVEAQPRKVNKKNRVVEPICDDNVKHSKLNANSDLNCATCKKSLFDDVHDKCLLDFVKTMNSHAKSAKKHKKENIWRPMGHVFTEVGLKWKPTGRTFTIVGNLCPLTRITSANIVPPKKTTSHSVETQKPELKVYSRKPKNVKSVGSSKKTKIVESKNANL
ncbi:hypothetical protein Tco_0257082 [Tanacetum coccineum]